nr:MAG TPA: capsid protein [Caudoviricetes sp.]
MADMKDIVKVAVDAYHGNVEQYSVGQSMELLHKALVEANGGSTVLNYRNIRDGKCNGLFTLIEEILSRTIVEGLQGDEYFNALVDFRNVAEGDKNIFVVEDSNLFVVAEAADGTQGIRRQRLGGTSEVSIPTSLKVVKIYDEMNRVLSGRVDFNTFINKVAESFRQQLLNDIYTLWSGATATDFGGVTYFPTAGAYDEDELLDLIAHVEAAANGRTATIIGTKKAVRNLAPSIQGSDSESDIYNLGYYGKFYGTPVMVTPQRHKIGSTEFTLDDNILTIIAGDDKPIKCVYEGNPIVLMGDPMTTGDLTQEYLYGEKYGMGIVLAGGNAGIGRYEIA